jgi:hypothetical protein
MISIEVTLEDEGARMLWKSLREFADRLPGEYRMLIREV